MKAVWLLVVLLLPGCAFFTKPADTVSFPRGVAYKTYANLRVSYAVIKIKMDLACAGGKLDATFCQQALPKLDEEMQRLDRRIMETLANPDLAVDWAAVGEAASFIATIALKFI